MKAQAAPQKGFHFPDLRSSVSLLWTGFCLIGFTMFLLFGWVNFETNDDLFLTAFPSGLFGAPTPYTTYSNIALGGLASLLTKPAPLANWSLVFYLLGMLAATIMLGRYLIRQNGWLAGGLLSATVLISTFYSVLHRLNYSKSGALIMMFAAVCFAITVEDLCKNTSHAGFRGDWPKLFLPGALLLFGSLFRLQTTIAVLPFLVLLATHNLESADKTHKFKQVLVAWLGLLFLCIAFWGADYGFYHANEAWSDFRTFNSLREDLLDYELPDYDTHVADYEHIGWSRNDYEMFAEWNFADPAVYNIDTLRAVKEMQTKQPINLDRIKNLLPPLLNMLKANFLIQVLLGLAVVLIILNPGKFWYLFLSLLLTCGELALLADRGRYPERAVFISVIASLAVLLFLSTTWHRQTHLIEIALFLVLCLFAVHASGVRYYGSTLPYDNHNRDASTEFFTRCSEDTGSLYVWQINSLAARLGNSYSPLDALPMGILSNTCPLGGWIVPAPVLTENAVNAVGSDNVMKALAASPRAYFVDTKDTIPKKLLTYIRQHYNPKAECVLEREENGFYIYRFISKTE